MTFAIIDIFFAVIVLFFAVEAAARGFVRELFSKLAFLLGLACAVLFYGRLTPVMQGYISNLFVCQILSFIGIFIVVYVAVRLLQQLLGSFLRNDIIAGLDKSLGFFLGIAEGVLIVAAVLILLRAQPWFAADALLDGSIFYSFLSPLTASSEQFVNRVFNPVSLNAVVHGSVYV